LNKGLWYAAGAYVIWGFFPIYWKWLVAVPALQLISHRMLWSFIILITLILVTRQWQAFRKEIFKPAILRIYALAGILNAFNWLVYVWGVNAGFIVETSLGYFINPLLSVLMGVIFLRERLRPWQWLPVGLAAIGVLYLTLVYGSLPWIALTLAFTFGTYGLVKKKAPLSPHYGLTLETGIMFTPVLLYLIYADMTGQGAFLHTDLVSNLLMMGAGVVTAVPLLFFAAAARRIPLSMIGIMQYIAPTLQFLIGVLVYGEPFTQTQFIGFSIVWIALIIFAIEGFLAYRARLTPVPVDVETFD
jgi:chloramphenicol-sensitive protein RarD